MSLLVRLATATARAARPWPQAFGRGESGPAANVFLDDMRGVAMSAEQVFASGNRLIIIGAPGAGKTTLMRNRALEMAEAYLENQNGRLRVPLLISARLLHDTGSAVPLHDYMGVLAHYCVTHLNVEVDHDELEASLRTGAIELLVDGLDELGLDWNHMVGQLSDLFRTMPQLCAVVSSRPAALIVRFADFVAYTIADLNIAQIQQVVNQMTPDQPQLAIAFARAMEQAPSLAALARTPLLLHIMLALLNEHGEVPASKSVLFSSAIDVMLSRWDARRRSDRPEQAEFRRSDIYAVLGATAAMMFSGSRVSISRNELAQVVDAVLNPHGRFDPGIEDTLTSNGLFIETAQNQFSFVHKAFAEYFTAWFYRDDVPQLIEMMSREDGEAVLEFACGIIENPAILIEKAVARGHLVLAAKMSTAGRFDNDTLQRYVAQAFRQVLGPRFLALLAEPRVVPTASMIGDNTVDPVRDATEIQTTPVETASGQTPPAEPASAASKDLAVWAEDQLLTLLDGVRDDSKPNEVRGRLFEEFAGVFFGKVFRVAYSNYLTDRGEIDLILELEPGGLYWSDFGNEALVECKNLRRKARYDQAATFITKLKQSRRKLGFIVSYLGFTDGALQAIHDNAADTSNALVIAITGEDIRKSLQLSEEINEFFKNAYRNATIPKRGRRRSRSRRPPSDD